jgi:hypothetical protein
MIEPCFFYKPINSKVVSLLLLYVDDLLGSFLGEKMKEEFSILNRIDNVLFELKNVLDFLVIGIEDHVYLNQKSIIHYEFIGTNDCNPTMMQYVSRFAFFEV